MLHVTAENMSCIKLEELNMNVERWISDDFKLIDDKSFSGSQVNY